METKEQLCKEYFACTSEYIQAHEKVSAVLKRWYEIREGGTTLEWNKVLTDFRSAIEDEGRAIVKLQELSYNRLANGETTKIE